MTATASWKDSILLPKTDFAMKADLAKREPELQKRWETDRLYHRVLEARAGKKKFVLHDGPPYANGSIHHGHALNKVLKDIVIKYQALRGHWAPNVPGWDCHGLPIEQKVDEELGGKKRELSPVAFRKLCRAYAEKHIGIQREQFKRLTILAEWERPYKTMDYGYEASIVRELGRFMEKGFVFKGLKPVHWSWAAVTALAEAEVEYEAYDAPSVYVRFAFPTAPAWLADKAGGRAIDMVIWTTTPWTLPSNLAIVLHPELEYELLALDGENAIVVANGLKPAVYAACGLPELETLHTFKGSELVGTLEGPHPKHEARHPFLDRGSVLLPADYVTLEQGTGCVHTAPGHGEDDFQTGRRFGLPPLSPVNKYGKYTDEVPDYVGKHVFEANPLISARLEESGRLLNKAGEKYHIPRYPHCWRTKKPLIFRATEQWFIGVDRNDLRARALREIGATTWIPHWGENRIRGMIEARPDWCISRQRSWGVPIPAFMCGGCGKEIVSHLVANHVADLTDSLGCDVWFERSPAELVPAGFTCPHCSAAPDAFEKVEDILDVWFDSGVSWAAVLRDREGITEQADLYLEGSDQHRGWFHTSLLTSVGLDDRAPFKSVLTHGFVVDQSGRKYSKSSPNYEPLERILDVMGADVLRLWVASVDYRNDVVLTPSLLQQVGESYRKIRNTIRFLLGNLHDFDPAANGLAGAALTDLDRWALARTQDYIGKLQTAYNGYEFHTAYHATLEFCGGVLSAVYLDALKDRLYCNDPADPSRRASQAVIYEALRALVIGLAPIISFTAEEAWAAMPHRAGDEDSVFFADFPAADATFASVPAGFLRLLEKRGEVQEQIEARRPKKKGEREPGQIGSSQEAVVTLTVPAEEAATYAARAAELAELFIVSEVKVELGSWAVAVDTAATHRCARCWNHRESVGSQAAFPDLCGRCADVVAAHPELIPAPAAEP